MIFRGASGLFSKKYPQGGPLENFEKNKKNEFFATPHRTSAVVYKKDAASPSRTAPQPPVCSNLAVH